MASGSSGRVNSGSKGFDFASDDILCSYEDYGNQDSNGSHSDPGIGTNSGKDFHKSRLARPMYSAPSYSQPEDSLNQDVVAIVEKSMKKYVDNIMRFLEGISSRLSQLELYCYNLDKSIGEMRSELNRDHGDAESRLKSLEKHLQEVHRSVQILRDKQELADTQKELAKLQLAQKETSSGNSQSSEERASTPTPETKKTDNASDTSNQQLALALPHQVAPPQSVPPPSQAPPQNISQQQAYYLSPAQIPNPSGATQLPQIQYAPSDPQGRSTQLQEISRVPPPSMQPQVNQTSTMHPFPQYQQQWSQQLPQPVAIQPPPQQLPQQVAVQPPQQQLPHQVAVQPPPQQLPHQVAVQPPPQQLPHQVAVQPPPQQQASVPPQIRAPPTAVYSPYPPNQPSNPPLPPPPQETVPSSMSMQMPYSGGPPPVSSHAESVPYGYGGPGRIVQQQPPQQPVKGAFVPQPGDGYAAAPQTPVPPGSGYMVYESDGGRTHHQSPQQGHFSQGMYPPPNVPHPNPQTNNLMVRNSSHPQFARNHRYGDLIDKLMSMGFRGDHVMSVIQRMEDSGQPVDFNAVLDRLSVHSSVGPQRGWSG